MFKLIKIRGSRTNVPETTVFNVDGVTAYDAGAVYFLGEGTLSKTPFGTSDVKFIPLETLPENSGKTAIRGYIVSEEMVFETKIYEDYNEVKVGDPICARTNENGAMAYVEGMVGEDAMLLSKDGVQKTRKVLVALKW